MSHWWVEQGYPPFAPCECGCELPLIGQVVAYYRTQAKMSQEELAQKLGIQTKKAVWEMENKGIGIVSRDRRVLLCQLLGIPSSLLGVKLLSEIIKEGSSGGPTDPEEHEQFLSDASEQHRSSSATHLLPAALIQTDALYRELPHTGSSDKKRSYRLLLDYHRFVASQLRVLQQDDASIAHLNKAMHFADTLKNDELRVVCLLSLGRTLNAMNRNKESLQVFRVAELYEKSVPDFLNGVCLLFSGPVEDKQTAIATIDRAGHMVRTLPKSDYAYRFDFSLQRYHLNRAETLINIGWNREALSELRLVQSEPVSWWRADQATLEAQAYANLGNAPMATSYAEEASGIINAFNGDPYYMARIESIHRQLATRQ